MQELEEVRDLFAKSEIDWNAMKIRTDIEFNLSDEDLRKMVRSLAKRINVLATNGSTQQATNAMLLDLIDQLYENQVEMKKKLDVTMKMASQLSDSTLLHSQKIQELIGGR